MKLRLVDIGGKDHLEYASTILGKSPRVPGVLISCHV